MSDCCSNSCNSLTKNNRRNCPTCGAECKQVNIETILHHIKKPWQWEAKQQTYYFCESTECNVVYFGEDDSVIEKSALRTRIGIKERSESSVVCYCFDVSFSDAIKNPDIKNFVIKKTKDKVCACDIRNPSGKCCLKDFPK